MSRKRVAIVGGGAAGIAAAWRLDAEHAVTLFERNGYVGGHTHTVVIADGPDAGTPVDTGFIVLNDRNYPTLHGLFEQWDVAWRWADMSFGYHCADSGLQYAGKTLSSLFAQPRNALRPRYWRMLADIVRFGRRGLRDLAAGAVGEETLGDYLAARGFSGGVVRDYIEPMGAAIWSTPCGKMRAFPARTFLYFFRNHGLLDLTDRPRWQTVVGGSHAYVKAFRKRFSGAVHTGAPVRAVARSADGAALRLDDGSRANFDAVVVAAHADEALALLAAPTADERRLLGPWRYERNRTVLHTDASLLPPNRRARASWNYRREAGAEDRVTLTYDMNNLQGLRTRERYCVTLNPARPLDARRVLREIDYMHPLFSAAAQRTQPELPRLNQGGGVYFCGSYFGYGFHEDAVKSGCAAAAAVVRDLDRTAHRSLP